MLATFSKHIYPTHPFHFLYKLLASFPSTDFSFQLYSLAITFHNLLGELILIPNLELASAINKAMAVQRGVIPLPIDVMCEVFDYLQRIDIKQLRLTSKGIHAIASHLLMSRAYVAVRRETMDAFNEIASHPMFSQTITEIVYDCSLFPEDPEDHDTCEHDFADH